MQIRRAFVLAVPVLLLSHLVSAAPQADSIGEKVVAFCQEHRDQQVGNGECSTLAGQALKHAGAKARGGKDNPNSGDYVWGTEIYMIGADGKSEGKRTEIHPGDIIQYRDVKFAGKKHTGKGTYTESASHHTAVVISTDDAGGTIHILQQNTNGKKEVKSATLYLGDLKSGWLRFYRPIADPKK